jgi:hypothetical protein
MKSIKQIIAILFISFISSQAYSQFSLGGQVSFLNLFGGTGLKNFGLGVKGEYAQSEKTILYGGINYFLASKYSDMTYANALSSLTSPSQIEVDVEYKVSFFHIYVGAKRYFIGDYEEDFCFYGFAEAGLLMAPVLTTLSGYDKSLYSATAVDGSKETLTNFTLGFGPGIEKKFDFGYIFSDIKLTLPANQANGETVEVQIPASFGINVGVRIPL